MAALSEVETKAVRTKGEGPFGLKRILSLFVLAGIGVSFQMNPLQLTCSGYAQQFCISGNLPTLCRSGQAKT